jgi:hypothetical protein
MNNEPLDLNWHNVAELIPPPFRPAPISDGVELPTWCSCGIHRATTRRPLCPVCLDERARESEHQYDPERCRCTCGALDHPEWGVPA